MTKTQNLFFSCVESRIQDQGSMYARFHLGTFFRGQALTFGNALRRTLLSEIPGVIITDVMIDGAGHEFATLPGVEETVLDILLNLKKLVFVPSQSQVNNLETFNAFGLVKSRGPGRLTAGDIKLPLTVKCVNPNAHIATLTSGEDFSLRLNLKIGSPHQPSNPQKTFLLENQTRKLAFSQVPTPIQKVNYVIKSLNGKKGSEYLVLEVWTDGSVIPQEAVQFALKNLTSLFYQFSRGEQKVTK